VSASHSNSDDQGILASSPAMCEILDALPKVASTDVSVLIQGESGTGKELIATAIHQLSRRGKSQMLTVHCDAFWPTLLEIELFGLESSPVTNAVERHIGCLQQATAALFFWTRSVKLTPPSKRN
jgi:DNA-binding NtrC family response regulator